MGPAIGGRMKFISFVALSAVGLCAAVGGLLGGLRDIDVQSQVYLESSSCALKGYQVAITTRDGGWRAVRSATFKAPFLMTGYVGKIELFNASKVLVATHTVDAPKTDAPAGAGDIVIRYTFEIDCKNYAITDVSIN